MRGELRGDISRDTFDPLKRFRRVLMQQGRVHLDSDWNEQTALLLHYLQALAADLIGPHGGPSDSFAISPLAGFAGDFRIGPGHYYVDGILCELAATPVAILEIGKPKADDVRVAAWSPDGLDFSKKQWVEVFQQDPNKTLLAQVTDVDPVNQILILRPQPLPEHFPPVSNPMLRRITTYRTQPDYPLENGELKRQTSPFLVYLDVWERHISCIQDDYIREVALGGPDTATRAKIVWQVRIEPNVSACPDPKEWATLVEKWQPANRGQLKARARQESASTDPCIVLPEARYRGAENQLYRVEIHQDGTAAAATFKWSRDNSSVELPIKTLQGTIATLQHLWRDSRFALNVDDWVEVVDDTSALLGHLGNPGVLAQVESLGDPAAMTVTLKPPSGMKLPTYAANDPHHPLLRRWDYQAGKSTEGRPTGASDGALLLKEGHWLELEDGVQVLFANLKQHYRTRDYWLIPARTATGDVEWPREDGDPVAQRPHGIEHHYAPLGIISVDASGKVDKNTTDCRKNFKTVVSLTS